MRFTYEDFALILAWPETTIRGDEAWMMGLKKLGLVKNLHFKVGHTGVVLVEAKTGEMHYYDFGRYITPRGLGRTRSKDSDPRLRITTQAHFNAKGSIQNLEEICEALDALKGPFQAYGKLYFSIAEGISFKKAKLYADQQVRAMPSPYGALAPGNNNCSRFITRLLRHASTHVHRFHGLLWPETIKSSPLSNVVNARKDREVYVYDQPWGLKKTRITRWGSLRILWSYLKENFNTQASSKLGDDLIIGAMEAVPRPRSVAGHAQWLGGIGEGAWYALEATHDPQQFRVSRYLATGERDYELLFFTTAAFDIQKPYRILHDSHGLKTTLQQEDRIIRMHALPLSSQNTSFEDFPLAYQKSI
jgi:hypothetical protein